MSPIGVALDLLVIIAVAGALFMGWRLSVRLKALRDSQEGFVKAVQELDAAARRAEHGLEQMRVVAEATQAELTAQLDEARALAARLERASAGAPAERPVPAFAGVAPTRQAPEPLTEEPNNLAAALRELRRRRGLA